MKEFIVILNNGIVVYENALNKYEVIQRYLDNDTPYKIAIIRELV